MDALTTRIVMDPQIAKAINDSLDELNAVVAMLKAVKDRRGISHAAISELIDKVSAATRLHIELTQSLTRTSAKLDPSRQLG